MDYFGPHIFGYLIALIHSLGLIAAIHAPGRTGERVYAVLPWNDDGQLLIATRKGLSVEIDNTDAEGRVILCDALTFAGEQKPDLVLDFATLTGAARIALGPDLPALFANDDAVANDWIAAGERTRDPVWRMPLWRPYLRYLTSGIADLANAGSRMAGAVTAALYLERFVPDGMKWAHLDVYAWNDSDRAGRPAGGEALALRSAYAMLKARYGV